MTAEKRNIDGRYLYTPGNRPIAGRYDKNFIYTTEGNRPTAGRLSLLTTRTDPYRVGYRPTAGRFFCYDI